MAEAAFLCTAHTHKLHTHLNCRENTFLRAAEAKDVTFRGNGGEARRDDTEPGIRNASSDDARFPKLLVK